MKKTQFMKNIIALILFIGSFGLFTSSVLAQDYQMAQLSQEPVNVTMHPMPSLPREKKDTSFTDYQGSSIPISLYVLNGPQFHPIINPAPTGVYINGQHFKFYCSIERSLVQYLSIFLDVYEFDYLGKKYLCFYTLSEECMTQGCRFKCYNLFDITNPDKIVAYAFNSILPGIESFGDFNFDGKMDVLTALPKMPESFVESPEDDRRSNVLITVYTPTVNGDLARMEKEEDGNPYYLYVKPVDEDVQAFSVLQYDWFMPFKKDNKVLEIKTFYPPYQPFDPKNDFMYDYKGHRIDKRRWVIHLTDFPEQEGAQEYCEELIEAGYREAYIKVDHYGPDFTFKILYGNYWSKQKAEQIQHMLVEKGVVDRQQPGKVIPLDKN